MGQKKNHYHLNESKRKGEQEQRSEEKRGASAEEQGASLQRGK